MRKFKSTIKQGLAILLSSTILFSDIGVYAVDIINSNNGVVIENQTIDNITQTVSGGDIIDTNESNIEITSTNSLDEFSNEISSLNEDDSNNLENSKDEDIYATKRLIVLSNTPEFDVFGANILSYDNIYILSYETKEECKYAYENLLNNTNIVSVEIDSIMETESNTTSNETSKIITKDTELRIYLNSLVPSKEVKVAILDTGIDTSKFDNIIDLGVNLSSSGEENSILDDNGHGTEMATIITNNSNDLIKLMPIKIANSDGKATILNAYLGIKYAIENDADIINISMNAKVSSQSILLKQIIDEANEKGIYVIVSAGNDNNDIMNVTPSNIDSAIVVSAINNDGTFADYSNYGKLVDYCSYGSYNEKVGTSYAAANMSNIVANLLSREIDISILKDYAIDLGTQGLDSFYGYGFIGYEFLDKYLKPTINHDDNNTLSDNYSAVAEMLYVGLGDTNFNIKSNFTNLKYNQEFYDVKYIDCVPEFNINKEGKYYVTYEFVHKENSDKNFTLTRLIDVIDNPDFIEDFYSLKTSATKVNIQSGSGTRYTAYSRLSSGASREFKSNLNLSPDNVRAYLALSALITCSKKVEDGTTTWAKIIAYGEAVSLEETLPTKPSGVSKYQCTLAYIMSTNFVSGYGVATKNLTEAYLTSVRTAVANMNAAGKNASSAADGDWNDYKTYFTSEKMYWTFYDAYTSFKELLVSGNGMNGLGPGYGTEYTDGPMQDDYTYYQVSNATAAGKTATKNNCYVLAVEADTKNGGGCNWVPILKNIYLRKNETITFKMSGKSCGHCGVYGHIWRSNPSSSTISYDSSNQGITVGTLTIFKDGGTDTASLSFTASEAGYYTFDCGGTAYSCKYAEIYITTTSEYDIKANAYTITLNNQSATTAGTASYCEIYNYGNYKSASYSSSNTISKITVPTKTGYTFGGYYTGTNGSGTQYVDASGNIKSTSTTFTSDATLYAKWIANTYTLTINPNGGKLWYDGSTAWTTNTINRTFTYGTAYNFASTSSYYTGTNGRVQIHYSGSGTASSPRIPYRLGYTFAGWTFSNGTGTSALNSDTNVGYNYTFNSNYAGNVTATAQWTIHKSKLTVNPNGGTWNSLTSSKTYEQNYNTTLNIPKPTITNYTATFNGNGGTSASSSITTSRTFSKWTRTNTYGTMSSLTAAATYTFGSTNNVTDTITANYSGSYTITLPSASRTGYTFNGWYTAASGGTKIGNAGATVTLSSNVTYYAQWSINTYVLTINPNGGSMYNGDSKTTNTFTTNFIYNRKTYLGNLTSSNTFYPINAPTRTGYTFNGFTFSGGTGGQNTAENTFYFSNTGYSSANTNSYIFNGNYGGNVTATAQWKPNVYTITLNNQSATTVGTTAYYEKYEVGNYTTSTCTTSISKITIPTKTGYTFGGYYTGTGGSGTQYIDASGNIKSTSTTFTSNTTLYAKWIVNTYNLTINPNGGTMYSNNTTKTTSTFVVKFQYGANRHLGTFDSTYYGYNSTVGLPTRTGYTFAGWKITSGGGNVNYYSTPTNNPYGYKTDDFTQEISRPSSWAYYLYNGNYAGNTTITAQWTIHKSKLTVNPNGGTWNSLTSSKTYEQNYNTTLNIPKPTITNYTATFNGNGGTSASSSITTNKAFSKWTRTNTYGTMSSLTAASTYTFGSTNNVTDTITANYSGSYTITLPSASRTGYTFNGWYTAASGGTKIGNAGATVTLSSNVTYYAQWTVNTYTVTYIDVIDSISGKELGRTTKQVDYGTIVNGSDNGNITTDNYYYKGYYYDSCTASTVTTSGATVYRIFKLRTITINGNIIWEDWNNKNLSRPNNVTLHLTSSNNNIYDFEISGNNAKNTTINSWAYSKEVPKYDNNGNEITYTITQDNAISKEEGLKYETPIIDGYNITNSINSTDPTLPKINIKTYVEWIDNDNKYGYKPNEITIQLLQNGVVIDEVNTSKIEYTFKDFYKYDENGNKYEYTVISNEVDRYSLSIDNDSSNYEKYITYTFQAPTFSVTIPKTVILDGQTGIGEYIVSVQGNIDNRDSIKVIPDSSFTMNNKYLSPITAIVKQNKTSFTNKDNISKGITTKGSITTKSLAGEWSGGFNFNIYFEFGE